MASRALRGFLSPTLFGLASATTPAVLAAGETLAEWGLVVSLHHPHELVLCLAIFLAEV